MTTKNDDGDQHRYLMTDNSTLFFELRGAVVTTEVWDRNDEKPWPSSTIESNSGKVRATVRIGPEPGRESMLSQQALNTWKSRVADYVVHHLDDLNADILDVIVTLFLMRASSPDQSIVVKAEDFLRFRGLQPRGNAYWTEQKRKIGERIALLSNTWIDLFEMEVVTSDKQGRRKTKVQKLRSRAIVVSSVAEEETQDGTSVFAWKVRPGDVFAPFLLGPGKQLAMLSQKILAYDFAKYHWEKRIARYLFWIARIRQGKGDFLKPLRIRSILDAIKKEIDTRYPNRFRDRFEAALTRLVADGVIRAWQYSEVDESIMSRRRWWEEWLDWLLVIELPQPVLDQYQKIKMLPAKSVDVIDAETIEHENYNSIVERMKGRRVDLKMTQLQLAELLGIHPNYLAQLERGSKRPSLRLAKKIETWFRDSPSQ